MRPSRLDPLPTRLRDAILSLQPTAYWPLDDGSSPLRDIAGGNWNATITGSPTFGVGAPEPIGRGVTFATGQYGVTSTSLPNAATALSLGVLFRTTDNTAADRTLMARRVASQATWQMILPASDVPYVGFLQSSGTAHCQVNLGASALNDGAWHLVIGTFDGTTATGYADNTAPVTSTSLTGSWYVSSTAAVGIANNSTGALTSFPGTLAHAFIVNRVVTDAERRWLHSIAGGG